MFQLLWLQIQHCMQDRKITNAVRSHCGLMVSWQQTDDLKCMVLITKFYSKKVPRSFRVTALSLRTMRSRFGWISAKLRSATNPRMTWHRVHSFFLGQTLKLKGVRTYQSMFANQNANTMMSHLTEQTHIALTRHNSYIYAAWHAMTRLDENVTLHRFEKIQILSNMLLLCFM